MQDVVVLSKKEVSKLKKALRGALALLGDDEGEETARRPRAPRTPRANAPAANNEETQAPPKLTSVPAPQEVPSAPTKKRAAASAPAASGVDKLASFGQPSEGQGQLI